MALTPLPIDIHVPELVGALRRDGALVLVAEPGAGKTTRVPRAMLDARFAEKGEIVVLEPRRLAVRMAARRVASELDEKVGRTIGYQVRFERKASDATRVRFVTEGILARRLARDPELDGVAAVLLDEFHERHLEGDLVLSWLKRLRTGPRPDLVLGVMSATLDAERLADFLGCTAMRVPGRTHDVSVEHLDKPDERRLSDQVASAVRRLVRRGLDGDVLVFLPGAAEIRHASDACADIAEREDLEVVRLHGDLPAKEQDNAVRPGARRKIILSTNVAETSVTIEGVVAVVDSGLARVARHSPWSGLPRLETARVSRASATQRAGRAGRMRAGVCLRLYTAHDHQTRPAHDTPEVCRADLAEVVLRLRAGGDDPRAFPWLDPPPTAALDAADELLARLGALDADARPTPLARRLLGLPIHPRLGAVALAAARHGFAAEGCALAALLSERDIRRSARTRLDGPHAGTDEVGASDLLARLDVFEAAEAEGFDREALRAHELDAAPTRAAARSAEQLRRALRSDGGAADASSPDPDAREEALLEAILAGYPDRVGRRRSPTAPEVVFAGGGSARLSPASVVKEAELMVACEVAERPRGGSQVRAASRIDGEWLLELFPDRVRDFAEARFDPERERVDLVRGLAYDGLVLDESRAADPRGPEVTRALVEAALGAGVDRFCDPDALDSLRRRTEFAALHDESVAVVDDAALRGTLERIAEGANSFAELRSAGLLDLVRAELGGAALRSLTELAPASIALPGRPNGAPVHYEPDRPPWIESHLQDFFGLSDGPRVAGGRVAVVLHLLAPNKRAVQVTTDLAGFWDRHYPDLAKTLGRRYPKHHWPAEPRTAEPRRLKRRR